MSTITKERVAEFIKNPLDNGLTRGEQMELARIALASLEAEAAGYMNRFTGRVFTLEEQPGADTDVQVYVPVYTAPPGPVSVPDEREAFNAWNNDTDCPLAGRDAKTSAWLAWCRRAAMLQGAERAESPSGNSPVIPDGYVLVPVELTGAMTNAMTDAILDDLHNVDIWRSVLAAAPQQEV